MPSSPPWWAPQFQYRLTFRLVFGCQFHKNSYANRCFTRRKPFAIKLCVESINSYLDLMNIGFVKNIIIAGFPGGGKKIVMMYIVIYAHTKGLTMITVSMMCHQSIQLVGWHWHTFLCIPVDSGNNMSVYRMTELAILKFEHFPNRIEFIRSIHMIANEKIGQTLAKFDNFIDNNFDFFSVWMSTKETNFFLEHKTQHNSNLLEEVHFWCPLVLFHVTKLFL